jgi:hypothetical protein
LAEPLDGGHGLSHFAENAAGVGEKHFSCRQESHAFRRSFEERNTELLFEVTNTSRQWGLRNVESPSSTRQVRFFGDDYE